MIAAPLDPLAVVGWSLIVLGTFVYTLILISKMRKWLKIVSIVALFALIQMALQTAR